MKHFITLALTLILALSLAACGGGAQSESSRQAGGESVSVAQSAQPSPSASPQEEVKAEDRGGISAGEPGEGRGDIIESGQSEPPYFNGFDFGPNLEYAEEYEIQGDPGEYLNAAEGAKLTFDTMKANGNIPAYSDDLQYTMTLVDLADINGEECYVYRLDVDEPSGTIGAAYAYAYQSGNIYMQGQGGQWVIPE